MATQRVRDLANACELLRSRYLPTASLFCRHKFASPKTKADLDRYFKTIRTDVRASSLPLVAQDNMLLDVHKVRFSQQVFYK